MSNLKQQMLSGVFYTAMAKYSGIVISLVVMAVLARLLTPEDFGIVAIATVIINFFGLFSNIGISAAIVQNKELTADDLNRIYAFTLWIGVGLSVLFFASSWPIAFYYSDDRLIPICQLLSVSLFLNAAALVPNTLFYRDKNFRFIAYRTFFIQVVTGALSVLAAFWGAGLYTLTIQPVLSALLIYIVSLRHYPQKFLFTWGMESVRKIWSYSLYQFLFNVVNYFSRNLDKLIIGRYLSMNLLGYYEKSYRLMMLPLQNITFVLTPVMHPVLSDYQNDRNKLAHYHERIVRLLAFIGFPMSILLSFCAEELVYLFFGIQWTASIPIFQILSLSVGTQLVLSSSGSFFQAGGDTRSLFVCGIFSSITNVTGILLGVVYFKSLEATAWCIVSTMTINFIQCYHRLYCKMLKRSQSSFYKTLFSPILIGLIVGIILKLFTPYLPSNLFLSLSTKAAIAVLSLILYIQLTKEYDIWKGICLFTHK